jgi:hypothetical protein
MRFSTRWRPFFAIALLILLVSCGPGGPVLVVNVQDRLTARALAGAECQVGKQSARSDSSGLCRLTGWTTQDTLQVAASGYQPTQVSLSSTLVGPAARSITMTVPLLPDRFTGQVLDDYTGQPLAGASVQAPAAGLTSDGAGQFTVLTPTFPLSLTVQSPGYDPWQGSFFSASARIALRPNTLSGLVLGVDGGKPLAGALVTVTGSPVLTTTTGADGRYRLQGVPEKFTIQVKARMYRRQEASLERTTSYDVSLRPAFLRGLVRDDQGQPLAQARVVCNGLYTHTNSAGQFLLEEVPETAVVQVLSPGFARQVVTVTNTPSVTVDLAPFHVQGIYVTAYVAGTSDWFDSLLDFVDTTELNAVVIEAKDAWGAVTYDSQLPLVQELRQHFEGDALWNVRYDVQEILRKCKERGIYTIAYIVTFEDSQLPEVRPEWAIQRADGSLWADRKGLNWTNPYRREVWDYNISIARELAGLGFDEVQFDYLRFPTDGNISSIYYSDTVGLTETQVIQKQYDTIAAFVQRAYEGVAPTGAFLSADVFGYAAWRKMWEQGQDISLMTRYLDYFCPMAYPSHYAPGEQGCDNPNACPYPIVLETMKRAQQQMTAGQRARIRPWLQDFDLGSPPYGPHEVQEEIRAAMEGGAVGWCLWNAGNVYTDGVDYSP